MDHLQTYPPTYHRLLAPGPPERIEAAERQLGTMPTTLKDMLQHFNGAELFIGGLPMLTIFGATTIPPLPPLEWAEDWYIDKLTPDWRMSGSNRDKDWAIGMTSYGGLILFNESYGISEWDTGESRWVFESIVLDDWVEKVIADGEAMMADR
jgi:hypothetical protein